MILFLLSFGLLFMSVMMRVSQMTREGRDSQVGGGLPATLAVTRVIFLGASRPVEGHWRHWPSWPSIISYPVTETGFEPYSVHHAQVNIDRSCIIICKLKSRASWSMIYISGISGTSIDIVVSITYQKHYSILIFITTPHTSAHGDIIRSI